MRAERSQRELGPLVRHVVGGPSAPPELVARFDADGDGDLGLADLVAAVRSRGTAPKPPNPVVASRAVRAGEAVRITAKTPLGKDVVVVASTASERRPLEARRVSDTELEVEIPPGAADEAGLVQIWLSRDGIAAGPAVVRVQRGPQVHNAAWISESRLRIDGEGFGSDVAHVTVDVDDRSLVPEQVSDERIELEVERERRTSWVTVRVGEERSQPALVHASPRGAA